MYKGFRKNLKNVSLVLEFESNNYESFANNLKSVNWDGEKLLDSCFERSFTKKLKYSDRADEEQIDKDSDKLCNQIKATVSAQIESATTEMEREEIKGRVKAEFEDKDVYQVGIYVREYYRQKCYLTKSQLLDQSNQSPVLSDSYLFRRIAECPESSTGEDLKQEMLAPDFKKEEINPPGDSIEPHPIKACNQKLMNLIYEMLQMQITFEEAAEERANRRKESGSPVEPRSYKLLLLDDAIGKMLGLHKELHEVIKKCRIKASREQLDVLEIPDDNEIDVPTPRARSSSVRGRGRERQRALSLDEEREKIKINEAKSTPTPPPTRKRHSLLGKKELSQVKRDRDLRKRRSM